jgi:hypothetical protein
MDYVADDYASINKRLRDIQKDEHLSLLDRIDLVIGSDLDAMASYVGAPRRDGEADYNLRARVKKLLVDGA